MTDKTIINNWTGGGTLQTWADGEWQILYAKDAAGNCITLSLNSSEACRLAYAVSPQPSEQFRRMREYMHAVYELSHPDARADELRQIAGEIECSSRCERCPADQPDRGEFCGFVAADSLRKLATALDLKAKINVEDQPAPSEARLQIKTLLDETGSRDLEDLKDMAMVGHATMAAIAVVIESDGPLKDWSPAQCPSEIITDMFNMLGDIASAEARLREASATVENLIRRDPACFNLSDELQSVRAALREALTAPGGSEAKESEGGVPPFGGYGSAEAAVAAADGSAQTCHETFKALRKIIDVAYDALAMTWDRAGSPGPSDPTAEARLREALERIPRRLFWLIGKGKLREDEPLYGVQIKDGSETIAEAEHDDLVSAIHRACDELGKIQCPYCTGKHTGLPNNACENCMNTGSAWPEVLVTKSSKPIQHWAVTVSANGNDILTIESNFLSGVPNIDEHADTVRTCAHHLLSFIGDGAPSFTGSGKEPRGCPTPGACSCPPDSLPPPSGGDEAKESDGEGKVDLSSALFSKGHPRIHAHGVTPVGTIATNMDSIGARPSDPTAADRREIVARETNDEFRIIPGFEDYEISRDCRLRRVVPISTTSLMPRFLRARPTPEGYLKYTLRVNGKTRSVIAHRAVALAWLGLPPDDKPCVAHLDNVRSNNNADNLRWVSYKENEDHKKAHGTYRQGTACISSRLNDDIVLDARKRHAKGGVTIKDLAVEYQVRVTTMADAVLGRSWKHLPMFEVERHPALDGGRDA